MDDHQIACLTAFRLSCHGNSALAVDIHADQPVQNDGNFRTADVIHRSQRTVGTALHSAIGQNGIHITLRPGANFTRVRESLHGTFAASGQLQGSYIHLDGFLTINGIVCLEPAFTVFLIAVNNTSLHTGQHIGGEPIVFLHISKNVLCLFLQAQYACDNFGEFTARDILVRLELTILITVENFRICPAHDRIVVPISVLHILEAACRACGHDHQGQRHSQHQHPGQKLSAPTHRISSCFLSPA